MRVTLLKWSSETGKMEAAEVLTIPKGHTMKEVRAKLKNGNAIRQISSFDSELPSRELTEAELMFG